MEVGTSSWRQICGSLSQSWILGVQISLTLSTADIALLPFRRPAWNLRPDTA
jgi:hypothetical protein